MSLEHVIVPKNKEGYVTIKLGMGYMKSSSNYWHIKIRKRGRSQLQEVPNAQSWNNLSNKK
jgi:hypothetical protein